MTVHSSRTTTLSNREDRWRIFS